MSIRILTLFNNKGGVGKTSIVYHLAWAMADQGHRVLAADLDPQANLTSAFLPEERLEDLWMGEHAADAADTIYRCVRPLSRVGDILQPRVLEVSDRIGLIPGDLGLSDFEDQLSEQWPHALGNADLYRPFRVLSSFWQVLQMGGAEFGADIILVDVGPNLGAINRSALIGTNHVLVPLSADLFSLQGMRNLGPTLGRWRSDWARRRENYKDAEMPLPEGAMEPLGYVVQQHGVRLDRPVKAYDKWVKRIPAEFRRSLLGQPDGTETAISVEADPWCLATMKHYRSLVPLGQEARKPIFKLSPADGAIGSHAAAVGKAAEDYRRHVDRIVTKMLGPDAPVSPLAEAH